MTLLISVSVMAGNFGEARKDFGRQLFFKQ